MKKPSTFQISCLSLFSIVALALASPGCTKTDALGAAGQDDSSAGGNAPTASGGGTGADGTSAGGGGGASSSDDAADGGSVPSCSGLTATCGPSGNESCCTSLLVPGGTFYRSYDGVAPYTDTSYPAMVADFYLDKYEITVGRFRQFVNAGMGTQASPPAPGAGAHPLIAGSGWDSTWNANLSADTESLKAAMLCFDSYTTWTDTAGSNESKPVNCLDWYTAFAFCAWDGGRLATEAEWNYAASGGSEQRYYPWSSPATSTTIDDSYAVFNCGNSCSGPQNVGSKSPKGDGKWGQSDLEGNVSEWTLDWYTSSYPTPCDNCAELTEASGRVLRGGGFPDSDVSLLQSDYRIDDYPGSHASGIGARCARTGGAISQGGSADAGQDGLDVSDLVPNICPSVAPGTGAPCASAGETCVYDGCTACVCMSNGTWECTAGPGDCASCPTTVTAGSPCTSNGLICLSWAFCGSECSCDGTTWSCALCGGGACGGSPCSSSPSCPATLPNDGQTCGALGNSCLYGWPAGCVKATCSCTVAGWSCSYGSYCLDAGE
ncbi:MAG: SUMF1/EgtB/PvdO family nonheme iron enzyme [Polyangia bacterium]|jgi:formylglycine-generating enzyme required for sulfatase activity